MSRLKELYKSEVKNKLMEKFQYKNVNMVPKLEKIVVNCVTKEAVGNSKIADAIAGDLALITGQKPVIARAKKSIASFKLREGQALGAFVTLRGERMYEFLDRLVNFALPRVRDFKGLNANSFDAKGNYTFGIKEQIIFPEINYDKVDKVRSLAINFITTAENKEEGRELLKLFGMPLKK